jgi:hypothetical protein
MQERFTTSRATLEFKNMTSAEMSQAQSVRNKPNT